jgi:hypothetical protein
MNEIFLIGTYADTEEKLKTLYDLVLFLKENNKKILISSHLTIPSFILKNCDYFIYDKENKLLTDKEYFGFVYFKDEFIEIYTKNAGTYNTSLAVLKLISNGTALCKSLGYNIIHYLEYDSKISDINEFNLNYEILKNQDVSSIGYIENQQMIGNYFCYNIDKLEYKRFIYDETNYKDLILRNGICETLVYSYLFESKSLLKDYKIIRSENFQTQLVQSGFLKWATIFEYKNDFYVFCYNNLNKEILFNVIIDGSSFNFWVLKNSYQIVKVNPDAVYVKIFGDNKFYSEYNIKEEKDLNLIRKNTFVNYFNLQ